MINTNLNIRNNKKSVNNLNSLNRLIIAQPQRPVKQQIKKGKAAGNLSLRLSKAKSRRWRNKGNIKAISGHSLFPAMLEKIITCLAETSKGCTYRPKLGWKFQLYPITYIKPDSNGII